MPYPSFLFLPLYVYVNTWRFPVFSPLVTSFICIGSFQAFNGPTNMFFFGGGQQKLDCDGLRLLGEWVVGHVLKTNIVEQKAWIKSGLKVTRRDVKMVGKLSIYAWCYKQVELQVVTLITPAKPLIQLKSTHFRLQRVNSSSWFNNWLVNWWLPLISNFNYMISNVFRSVCLHGRLWSGIYL